MKSVSIVVEWETVLEGKLSRGEACLASLRAQIAEHPLCETIVCFDPAESTEAKVRAAIGETWPGSLVIAAVPPGLDYYGKKNHGFTLTSGEVVVFLDSDLVPERDWLRNLVAPFDDYRISLVVGRTHLETTTVYERAVALFWIFDTRDAAPLRPTGRLVSNNVAFRRALFAHFPFPERPTFRGQCSELASILESRRIVMYEQPSARASHPAPDGVRRFVTRAFHAGTDNAYYAALDGGGDLRDCIRRWLLDLRHVRQRIAARGPDIAARRRDRIAAHVLGHAYYAIKAAGYARAALISVSRLSVSRQTTAASNAPAESPRPTVLG